MFIELRGHHLVYHIFTKKQDKIHPSYQNSSALSPTRKDFFKTFKCFFQKHLTFPNECAIIPKCQRKAYLGVAQLVARYLGVVEAASSSLVTQTRKSRIDLVSVLLFLI